MVVLVVASSTTTTASALGVPISLALSTVTCLVGLGWGRATRPVTVAGLVRGELDVCVSVDAATADTPERIPAVGDENPENVQDIQEVFDPSAVVRFVAFWTSVRRSPRCSRT
jgi:PiT family inorganic phosphate transporter